MFKIGINCLLIKDNQILLGKRLSKSGNNTWGMPGGKMEFGEHFEDCMKRELFEETGLVAEKYKFLQLLNDPSPEVHYIHINFLVEEWSGNLENKEPEKCAEWKWFDLNNLPKDIYFGHEKFIPAYLNSTNFIS